MNDLVKTDYFPKHGYQPTFIGTDSRGRMMWELIEKAPWHQAMFPVPYAGNFGEQWMWFCFYEKGVCWDD